MKSLRVMPLVTEKSMQLAGNNIYQFVVPTWAAKPEISRVIELLFNVNVEGITTARYSATSVRFKQKSGKTAMYKKATVTLKKGQTIADFSLPVETETPAAPEAKSDIKAEPVDTKTESTITVRSKSKKKDA